LVIQNDRQFQECRYLFNVDQLGAHCLREDTKTVLIGCRSSEDLIVIMVMILPSQKQCISAAYVFCESNLKFEAPTGFQKLFMTC
jgi:hypothetical protein